LSGFVQFQNDPGANGTQEKVDVNYNLGYTYFKLKDYTNAVAYFKKYGNGSSTPEKLNDSYLRLGDSYFVTSKYNSAIDAYKKALSTQGRGHDYAAFQRALSYGFVGKGSTKIDELSNFVTRYPKSKLKDDALFELGNSYIKINNENEGLATYDRLIKI